MMSMRSALFLIVFMGCMSVWVESQRGNYPELNRFHCGLSRLSVENDSQCFEWHNNGVTSDQIRNGMNVSAGLVPWVVAYKIYYVEAKGNRYHPDEKWCSGSLIADKWVLTAAHCLKMGRANWTMIVGPEITLFSGHNFRYKEYQEHSDDPQWLKDKDIIVQNITKYYKHPNFTWRLFENITAFDGYSALPVYDIGLIELPRPLPMSVRRNTICLPNENYLEPNNSYVLTAGYGDDRKGIDSLKMPFRVTYAKTIPLTYSKLLGTIAPEEAGDICAGDSGGPVWQYYMGRAVLLGITSSGDQESDWPCNLKKPGFLTRVSMFIDWIISVTELDTWHLRQSGHSGRVDQDKELDNLAIG